MGAVAAGELPDPFDALGAALGDHLGGTELAAQLGACLVPRMSRIRSAPSRLAARTADSLTAPSPSTVTVVRGPTPARTAQRWPVQNTSDKVSSDANRAESSPTGSRTSVPWASTTPRNSWPMRRPGREAGIDP